MCGERRWKLSEVSNELSYTIICWGKLFFIRMVSCVCISQCTEYFLIWDFSHKWIQWHRLKKKKKKNRRGNKLFLFTFIYSEILWFYFLCCTSWIVCILAELFIIIRLYYYLPPFICLALLLKFCTLVFHTNFSQ